MPPQHTHRSSALIRIDFSQFLPRLPYATCSGRPEARSYTELLRLPSRNAVEQSLSLLDDCLLVRQKPLPAHVLKHRQERIGTVGPDADHFLDDGQAAIGDVGCGVSALVQHDHAATADL